MNLKSSLEFANKKKQRLAESSVITRSIPNYGKVNRRLQDDHTDLIYQSQRYERRVTRPNALQLCNKFQSQQFHHAKSVVTKNSYAYQRERVTDKDLITTQPTKSTEPDLKQQNDTAKFGFAPKRISPKKEPQNRANTQFSTQKSVSEFTVPVRISQFSGKKEKQRHENSPLTNKRVVGSPSLRTIVLPCLDSYSSTTQTDGHSGMMQTGQMETLCLNTRDKITLDSRAIDTPRDESKGLMINIEMILKKHESEAKHPMKNHESEENEQKVEESSKFMLEDIQSQTQRRFFDLLQKEDGLIYLKSKRKRNPKQEPLPIKKTKLLEVKRGLLGMLFDQAEAKKKKEKQQHDQYLEVIKQRFPQIHSHFHTIEQPSHKPPFVQKSPNQILTRNASTIPIDPIRILNFTPVKTDSQKLQPPGRKVLNTCVSQPPFNRDLMAQLDDFGSRDGLNSSMSRNTIISTINKDTQESKKVNEVYQTEMQNCIEFMEKNLSEGELLDHETELQLQKVEKRHNSQGAQKRHVQILAPKEVSVAVPSSELNSSMYVQPKSRKFHRIQQNQVEKDVYKNLSPDQIHKKQKQQIKQGDYSPIRQKLDAIGVQKKRLYNEKKLIGGYVARSMKLCGKELGQSKDEMQETIKDHVQDSLVKFLTGRDLLKRNRRDSIIKRQDTQSPHHNLPIRKNLSVLDHQPQKLEQIPQINQKPRAIKVIRKINNINLPSIASTPGSSSSSSTQNRMNHTILRQSDENSSSSEDRYYHKARAKWQKDSSFQKRSSLVQESSRVMMYPEQWEKSSKKAVQKEISQGREQWSATQSSNFDVYQRHPKYNNGGSGGNWNSTLDAREMVGVKNEELQMLLEDEKFLAANLTFDKSKFQLYETKNFDLKIEENIDPYEAFFKDLRKTKLSTDFGVFSNDISSQESSSDMSVNSGLRKQINEVKDKRAFNCLIQSKGVVKEKLPDSDDEEDFKKPMAAYVPDKTTESFQVQVEPAENPADQAALAVFVKEASARGQLPLPLLLKINNQQLHIRQYAISTGIATGLKTALAQYLHPIQSVILDQTKLSDEAQASIFEGLSKRKDVKKLVSIGNEFKEKSIDAMIKGLIDSYNPQNKLRIEELMIAHCKVTQHGIYILLNAFIPKRLLKDNSGGSGGTSSVFRQNLLKKKPSEMKEKPKEHKSFQSAFAKKLMQRMNKDGVSAKLETNQDDGSLDTGGQQYMIIQPSVKKLALVGCMNNERQFQKLLSVIKFNKSITEYNLSWNHFTTKQVCTLVDLFRAQSQHVKSLNLSFLPITEKRMTQEQQLSLGLYISKANQLLHLDLSATVLGENLILTVLQHLKRSLSLVAIHLSNLTFTQEHWDFVWKKLKAVHSSKKGMAYHENNGESQRRASVQGPKGPMDLETEPPTLSRLIKQFEKQTVPKHQLLSEHVKLKNLHKIIKSNRVIHDDGGKLVPSSGENLILQRILGHPEIPNSNLWHAEYDNEPYQQKCWICDKHKYVMVFFDMVTQRHEVIGDRRLSKTFKQALFKENPNFQRFMHSKQDSLPMTSDEQKKTKVYISGSMTEWKSVRMLGLSDMIHKMKQGKEKDENTYRVDLATVMEYWQARLAEVIPLNKNAITWVNCPDKHHRMDTTKETFYVYAGFAAPGKHRYVVMSQEDDEASLLVHKPSSFFNQPLNKDHRVKLRSFKTQSIHRIFDRNKSVFSKWRPDWAKSIKLAITFEMQYWKVPRFIKDVDTVEAVKKILLENALFLKTLWIELIATSNYPALTQLDYTVFVQQLGIICEDFNDNDAARVFIAAKSAGDFTKELVAQNLPEKDFVRYEWLEALVRLANQKYIVTKEMEYIEDAVEQLMKILHEKFGAKVSYWQDWREKNVWTLDVDDLFKANIVGLQKIYKAYCTEYKPSFTNEDASKLLQKDTLLQCTDKQVIYAFTMSKSTVVNDITQREQYGKMDFAEFLEMIVRFTHIVFKDETERSFEEKLERVVDQITTTFGFSLKSKVVEVEYVSQSEGEYEEDEFYK